MWTLVLPLTAIAVTSSMAISCEEARLKCAYRIGCGKALQNYLVGCSMVLQNPNPIHCPEVCQHSLVALTSTEEGQALMNCECSDSWCISQKQRSEICRPAVTALQNAEVVPCRVAQWICVADAMCDMALAYYNSNCKAMFHGKKCTYKCQNSISVLKRQEKAEKLKTCECDGHENYDCFGIQHNMNKLCTKHSRHHNNTRTNNNNKHHNSDDNNNSEHRHKKVHTVNLDRSEDNVPFVVMAQSGGTIRSLVTLVSCCAMVLIARILV